MTMRSYDDVDFRPWYLPDTARWLKLSLGARGLVAELVRKLDRHGRIALGDDPAADLAVILRVDEADMRKALTELLAAERLVWDPVARVLTDPDLPARLRLGSAARMAKKRARDAERAANDAPSQPVTRVTSGDTVSPSDLIWSDLLEDQKEPDPARATPAPIRPQAEIPDPSGPPPLWWADVLATIHAQVGVLLASGECWLAYAGHRAKPDKRLPATREDALQWLVQVMVPKARRAADEARRARDRDAKYDAARARGPGVPEPLKPVSQEQAEADAKAFAARVAARKAREKDPNESH